VLADLRPSAEPLFDELDREAILSLNGLFGCSHCLIEQVPFPPVVFVSRSVLDVEPIVEMQCEKAVRRIASFDSHSSAQ